MKRAGMWILVAGIAFVAIGCQNVSVKDTAGKPVSFATVQVVSKDGTAAMPALTGFFGNALAPVPMGAEGPQYVTVTKDGYGPMRVTRREGAMEVTVRKAGQQRSLQKTAKQQFGGTGTTGQHGMMPPNSAQTQK